MEEREKKPKGTKDEEPDVEGHKKPKGRDDSPTIERESLSSGEPDVEAHVKLH